MAKAKKGELTIEDALVPVDEQPYEIPGNWCWVKLGSITDILAGGTPSRGQPSYWDGNIPWVKIGDMNGKYVNYTEEFITEEGYNNSSTKLLPKGTLLYSVFATIGAISILSIEATTNQAIVGLKHSPMIDTDFLYYALMSVNEYIIANGKGVAQKNINQNILKEAALPLPPLAEQQRIVEQIENLFSKLDKAKEKVQVSIEACEDRKNAIFARAFSGELTEKWRQKNGVSKETWKTIVSQDACEPITCGKTPTGFITDEGEIPYLKVYNIVDNKIDFISTPQFIPRDIHEGKLKSSRLKTNDVIMNIVGPPLRKIAIIPEEYDEWNMNQAIVRFRPKSDIMDYRFVYYTLLNPETLEEVIAQTRGVVGQANISVTQSRNLIFKCPSLKEQMEIVKLLDELLQKEDDIYNASVCVLEKIDSMKKAILASAFRGKLGTNSSNDEKSIELLKKILEGKK